MGKALNGATCRVCGDTIAASGKGRPPTYCSTGCRRMAEYEIRRLVNTIERLENRARDLRNPAMFHNQNDAAEAEFVAAELVSVRKQLRELLAAE